MDRELDNAERRVLASRRRVLKQRGIVARLLVLGRDATAARSLLEQLESVLRADEERLAALRKR